MYSFGTPKKEDMGEKKERTGWQKLVRGFWITIGVILAVIIFGFIALFNSGPSDIDDLTDNQEYVITVTHEATTYTYYCTGYTKNMINGSYILVDYEGKPTAEIFLTNSMYLRVQKNPNYKKEYFEKEKEEEVPPKSV